MEPLKSALVFNQKTILYPRRIRNYLKKATYSLCYDPTTGEISLEVDDNNGRITLLEIKGVTYDFACKMARELGLKQKTRGSNYYWEKWNPLVIFYDDGSNDAKEIFIEILKLGIPYKIYSTSDIYSLWDGFGVYKPPKWSKDQIIMVLKDIARRYRKSLKSNP